MQSRPRPSGRAGRPLGGELVIPALALAFTAYYVFSIRDAPWTAKVSTYFIGSVLTALIVLFVAVGVRQLLTGEASLSLARLASPGQLVPRRLGLLGLTVAYVYVLEWGGFTITTFVYMLSAVLLLGGRAVLRTAIVLAAGCALGGYVLFIAIFETRFPKGPFERLMTALF